MIGKNDFNQSLECDHALCNRWVELLGLCHRQAHRQDDQVNNPLINLGYVYFDFHLATSNKKAPRDKRRAS